VNWLDYSVLLATLLAIPLYGLWKLRAGANLGQYLRGDASIRWLTIGLSVLATQAGPITFLSLPGQAYESGLGFVQNYFGQPLALLVVCAVFLPIFQRLKVFTAYEYLGQRFDRKTRLLGAGLFLIQRGLAAGITLYAPAIILSALLGWRLDLTIGLTGAAVIGYTVLGGAKVVSFTQQYQMGVIFLGMAAAFALAVWRLPADLSFPQALAVAGKMGKLQAVDFSFDPSRRYTIWSGVLGGFFLALSYFGADQSQVGRYLAGGSLEESRFGLLFNAAVKVPMQFFILLLGATVFLFYQFEKPPLLFNTPALHQAEARGASASLTALETDYDAAFAEKKASVRALAAVLGSGDAASIETAAARARGLDARVQEIRAQARRALVAAGANPKSKDSDFVFLTFVLQQLPHGLVGLLVAVIFSAAMSATAATLSALGSTTAVDFYRPVLRPGADDAHTLRAAKCFTAAWGCAAIGVALGANLVENLIEAGNILGSIFYGPILGLFVTAFFFRRVGGHAVFIAALAVQAGVLALFFTTNIGYLWFNFLGCVAVPLLATVLQASLQRPIAENPDDA